MISTKKHIQQLVAILYEKGITDIIISPGSRSGALVHTFTGCGKFNCRSIVDERSAAYFAIGLSQNKKKPVAIVCSSGTATLNFAPAVAEAFYLNVPIVVLTADRPNYWINQGENQTIIQNNIYRDFCKKEITLPINETNNELWFAQKIINETINIATNEKPGPVHINIPMEEPLHNLINKKLPKVNIIENSLTENILKENELINIVEEINKAKSTMIIAGQNETNNELQKQITLFSEKTKTVVIKEHLANINNKKFFNIPDLLIPQIKDNGDKYTPDLLISFGGHVVSKQIKQFLKKYPPKNHWHISLSGEYYDTYQSLTRIIKMDESLFFKQITKTVNKKNSEFFYLWENLKIKIDKYRDKYMSKIPFSDLSVFYILQKYIPENSILHLGNSSPVRYALLMENINNVDYYGNRGTSGIDGSLSTAVGFASNSKKINIIILGDLSFFYDSNALWNNYVSNNLRIIVINNGGGNIFNMINGTENTPALEKYFITENRYRAEGIAKTFNMEYYAADNKKNLLNQLKLFFNEQHKKAAVLEIFTNAKTNSEIYKSFFLVD